jgi:hypothetical protein
MKASSLLIVHLLAVAHQAASLAIPQGNTGTLSIRSDESGYLHVKRVPPPSSSGGRLSSCCGDDGPTGLPPSRPIPLTNVPQGGRVPGSTQVQGTGQVQGAGAGVATTASLGFGLRAPKEALVGLHLNPPPPQTTLLSVLVLNIVLA